MVRQVRRLPSQGGNGRRFEAPATACPSDCIKKSRVPTAGSENCTVLIHRKPASDRIGSGQTSRHESTEQRDAAGGGMRRTTAVDEGSHFEAFPASFSFEGHDKSALPASWSLLNVDQPPWADRESSRGERVIEGTTDLGGHPMAMDLPEAVGVTKEPDLLVVG
jgi:hypothetical protein